MAAVWYAILAAMLSAWAVLDGFDFGAGIVHFIVARTERERGTILAAIGPVWDGNEVWLVAAGGVFVFAFPHAYAAAMSGMYLALVMVLWLLVLRGVAIELRSQVDHPMWRSAWDGVFAAASTAMALVAGVALGNVVRGVPVGADGWFHLDLFAVGDGHMGAIDGYTSLLGAFALTALAAHGSTYLAWKTEGELRARSLLFARRAWIASFLVFAGVTATTLLIRRTWLATLAHRPWAWPWPLLAAGSGAVLLRALGRAEAKREARATAANDANDANEATAFAASSGVLASILLATASLLYPALLPSSIDPRFDIDAQAAATARHALAAGLTWWVPAMALAIAYLVNIFRSMRGKVRGHGHGQ